MLSLVGTSAADIKFGDYHKGVWLFVVRADEPTAGEDPQYVASRVMTINSKVYEDLLAGASFEMARLPLKGGIGTVSNFQLIYRNEGGIAQALEDDFFLENDEVEAYLLFDDGSVGDIDRIPVGRGVIDQHPSTVNEWRIGVVDASDRDFVEFPQLLIDPADEDYAFAPLDAQGKPLPVPFGIQEQGPYDDNGLTRFLSRCRCTNFYDQKYTAGLHSKSATTPFQYYEQANRLAEVLNYTDSGAYFTIDDPARKLFTRPVRKDTTNNIDPWSNVADGKTSTSVVVGSTGKLDLFFAGVPKLGSLTAATVEVKAVGSFDYTVKLGVTTLETGSDTNDTSISLAAHLSNWAEDWDFQTLLIQTSTGSSVTVQEIYLDVRFDDQMGIDTQKGLPIFRKVQGFEDQVSKYNADGVTNPLITGVAGTVLENPVDQLQAMLRAKDLLNRSVDEIDLASFTTARAKRTAWKFAFTLFDPIRSISDLDPFLQDAGLFLFKGVEGKWKVIARDETSDPQHTFLSQWNVAVENPEDDYSDYKPEILADRIKTRDLINEFVIHSQRDSTTGEYNLLQIASSAYRIKGAGSTSSSTSEFIGDAGTTLITDGVKKGWIIYMNSDQAYRTTAAPTTELRVPIEPVEGSQIFDSPVGTTFWAGLNLDAEVLRARRRYKTLNPLGRPRQGLRDIGGYEAKYIGDAATTTLMIDHWRKFHGRLPLIVPASTFVGHLDVELGDTCLLDDPALPDSKRAVQLTVLDGAIDDTTTTIKVTDGEVGLIHDGDMLLILANARSPELVKVTADVDEDNDTVPVLRGQYNTQAIAHADGATIKRIIVKWEVVGLRPPAPSDARIRMLLLEMPNSYFPPLVIAPESVPDDWSLMSAIEKARYGAITLNSGLVEDRDPTTGFSIAAD